MARTWSRSATAARAGISAPPRQHRRWHSHLPWHHARFDLRSGPTFDLWADDVPLRVVRIVDGDVWVAAAPTLCDEAAHWRRRLHDGLTHYVSLVTGKAVLGAIAAGNGPPKSCATLVGPRTHAPGHILGHG